MLHPAGLAVYKNQLFVLGQIKQQLLAFDIPSSQYLGKIITGLPDAPEQILIVNC
jgi:hypothetical protein